MKVRCVIVVALFIVGFTLVHDVLVPRAVAQTAAVVQKSMSLDDDHRIDFHLDAKFGGSLDLMKREGNRWVVEVQGELVGFPRDHYDQSSVSADKKLEIETAIAATFAASQALITIEVLHLSDLRPSYVVTFALPEFQKYPKPPRFCSQRQVVHFEQKSGRAIFATKGSCVELTDLKAKPQVVVESLISAAKSDSIRVLATKTAGWAHLEVVPPQAQTYPKSYCSVLGPRYEFADSFYYNACEVGRFRRHNDDYSQPVLCNLGKLGTGVVSIRYGRAAISGDLRLSGWMQQLVLYISTTHTQFVTEGSATVDLPVSELKVECRDGSIRISDPANPCAVYEQPIGSADDWLNEARAVLVGESTPECTEAKRTALGKARESEAASPCSLAKIIDVKVAAVRLYKKRQPQAAADLLLPKLRDCKKSLLDRPALAAKVYADMMLYMHRAGKDDVCWELGDELQSMSPFKQDSAAAFNRELCGMNRYVKSQPLGSPWKPLKSAPKNMPLCKGPGILELDFDQNGDNIARRANAQDDTVEKVIWVGKLTSESVRDIGTFNGMCGNHGDCMVGMYVGCGGNRYVEVFNGYVKGEDIKVLTNTKRVGRVAWHGIELGGAEDTHGEDFGAVSWFDGKEFAKTSQELSRLSALYATVLERQKIEDNENPVAEP